MKYILIFFCFYLFADTDFLSKEEYQLSLYKNPRGIGCDKCHGLDGSEQVFSSYIENKVKKEVIIPSIKDISYNRFYDTLTKKNKSKLMPNYYLTDNEIKNLYLYLQKRIKNDE